MSMAGLLSLCFVSSGPWSQVTERRSKRKGKPPSIVYDCTRSLPIILQSAGIVSPFKMDSYPTVRWRKRYPSGSLSLD